MTDDNPSSKYGFGQIPMLCYEARAKLIVLFVTFRRQSSILAFLQTDFACKVQRFYTVLCLIQWEDFKPTLANPMIIASFGDGSAIVTGQDCVRPSFDSGG